MTENFVGGPRQGPQNNGTLNVVEITLPLPAVLGTSYNVQNPFGAGKLVSVALKASEALNGDANPITFTIQGSGTPAKSVAIDANSGADTFDAEVLANAVSNDVLLGAYVQSAGTLPTTGILTLIVTSIVA